MSEQHRRFLREPLVYETCSAKLADLARSVEWSFSRLAEAREERDRY